MTAVAKSTVSIGGYSRRDGLRKIDGRTRSAKYLRQIERELTEHLGGSDRVSTPQRYLVGRVAVDLLRLRLLDAEMAAGTVSEHDARVAHALRNSVRLALREIGFAPAAARQPSLAEVMAEARREREARGEAA